MAAQGHVRIEPYHLSAADPVGASPPDSADSAPETYPERVQREHYETLAKIDREREARYRAEGSA